MKWTMEDIDMFEKAKEYVDTIILPLLPIDLGGQMKKAAEMTEYISILSLHLENRFKGRLILLPGFSYFKSKQGDKLVDELLEWERELLASGFKHVFYLTADGDWKMHEHLLEGSLLWFPTIPLQQMEQQFRNTILEDQVNQVHSLFLKKWQISEQS